MIPRILLNTKTQAFKALRSYSTPSVQESIYELRTYSLVPQDVGKFMALSKEKFHLRTKHSVLLGYWTAELGGLNQVVHIWKYDSYQHRASVRAKLGGDAEWQAEYFQKILPWLQHQDNCTLKSLMEPVENLAMEGGTFQLWQLDMKPDITAWSEELVSLAKDLADDESQLYGAWSSVFGPLNSGFVLWRHQDIDQAHKVAEKLKTTPGGLKLLSNVTENRSKILSPTLFSPWK